jgi:hypothetical protein
MDQMFFHFIKGFLALTIYWMLLKNKSETSIYKNEEKKKAVSMLPLTFNGLVEEI